MKTYLIMKNLSKLNKLIINLPIKNEDFWLTQ